MLLIHHDRESARECRRRQRAHAEELAARVAALQTENRHLQLHLQTVQERIKVRHTRNGGGGGG